MKELTAGSPTKIILAFAAPIVLGSLFQQLYSMIDMVIVGQTVGLGAVAALGSTTYISNLIIGFMGGLTNGFAIITARHFGAGDYQKMRRAVAGTIILGLVLATVLTAASHFILADFLRILSTPDDIFDMAYDYISVILLYMVTAMLYNMAAGILRAVGDSITPLIFLIFSSLLNIGLDYLLISWGGMGVKGAAYATVISQTVSFLLCLVLIIKRFPYLIPQKAEFAVSAGEIMELLSMGLSMAMMFSIIEIGSLVLQSAINGFGTNTIAAHTAARKLSSILMLPYSALGSACATYCSQNLGAREYARIGRGIKTALGLACIWSCGAIAIGYMFSGGIISFITSAQSDEVTALAVRYMKVNTPFYFILGAVCVFRSSLQGLGRKLAPIGSSIVELGGKVLVTIALAPTLGYFGVMISEPSVWIVMTMILAGGMLLDRELRAILWVKQKQIDI